MTFKDDPSYAWAIALSPLASVVVSAIAPTAGAVVLLVVTVALVVLIQLDISMLARKGVGVEVLDGVYYLIPPWYLIRRTKYVGSPAAIPIVWFATYGLAVLVLAATLDTTSA